MSDLFEFLRQRDERFRSKRLASLYSDFRYQRTTNPDGYAANIAAWEAMLQKAVQAGKIPGGNSILALKTGPELSRALETKEWGRPLALDTVVDESIRARHMMPLEPFLNSSQSIYGNTWSLSPWALATWGLRQLGFDAPRAQVQGSQVVIIKILEEAGDRIVNDIGTPIRRLDRILSWELFRTKATESLGLDERISDKDTKTLLTYLARDKKILSFDSQTVKFKGQGEQIPEITDQDRSIASLKTLIIHTASQVDKLSTKISELSEKARLEVAKKNRTRALASLRSKKLHEGVLEKRTQTLFQLEEIWSKIEEADDQIELIKVIKASTRALRSIHTEIGDIESVENVIDNMKDEMDKGQEIQTIINKAGQNPSILDEEAVDDELQALEKEARAKEEEQQAADVKQRLDSVVKTPTEIAPSEAVSKVPQNEDKSKASLVAELGRVSLEEARLSQLDKKEEDESTSNLQEAAALSS